MIKASSNLGSRSVQLPRTHTKHILKLLFLALVLSLFYNNCSNSSSSGSNSSFSTPPKPYCPYLPSKLFSEGVSISGQAVYEYRIGGNGEVATGVEVFAPLVTAGIQKFSVTINSQNYFWLSPANFTANEVLSSLAEVVNADPEALAIASPGPAKLTLTPRDEVLISSLTYSDNLKKLEGDLPHAIRFAEVTITDASQSIVQCAETDASGSFSFELPKGAAEYKVSISSRANNTSLQAYVLQDPDANQTHSISTFVSATQSTNQLRLIAKGDGSLEGGAFNILDQLARTNIFLRKYASVTQGCGATEFPDCTPFTVAPMVYVYWQKGFNPGIYEGLDPNSGISYFLPSRNQLYIMGGINGDVNFSDTDHFDNSIIIHEYGHFIESNYGKSDSPGGSHDGFSQLDPRLAWSEGWADFFQASVTGDPFYRDTYGNPNGTAGVFFNEDIEHLTALSADRPNASPFGEGIYHEFSITRLLWDAFDSKAEPGMGKAALDDQVQAPFAEIWSVFSGRTSGFRDLNQHFRSMGLFHLLQNSKSSHTDFSSLRESEFQDADRRFYGAILQTTGCSSSSTLTINPKSTFEVDYFRNDRFYSYYHTGGPLDVLLNYNTPSGALADLDLSLYPERHNLEDYSSRKGSSEATPPVNCTSSTQCSEHIMVNLTAGFYLINVSASVLSSGPTNFSLMINSNSTCVTN